MNKDKHTHTTPISNKSNQEIGSTLNFSENSLAIAPSEKLLSEISLPPKSHQRGGLKALCLRTLETLLHFDNSTSIDSAIREWLEHMDRESTKQSYRSTITALFQNGPITMEDTLAQLTQDKLHESISTFVQNNSSSTQGTLNHHIRCLFSFFNFLEKHTQGETRIDKSFKEEVQKRISRLGAEPRSAKRLDIKVLNTFLEAVNKINVRDASVAYLLIRTDKHPLDIINLKKEDLSVKENTLQLTEDGSEIVSLEPNKHFSPYHETFISNIASLLKMEGDFCFATKKGKPIQPSQIKRTFEQAGKRANLPFRITPKILQDSGKNL
ncbi:hypothetical protein SCG7109_AJ_00170 [Chlamydiales bacterium SCGC AG-110-M15]|nr:hypothetical protein SCG7109_AJ_00170 [Chlamydiales bacterium SCGC AG-110-M15]